MFYGVWRAAARSSVFASFWNQKKLFQSDFGVHSRSIGGHPQPPPQLIEQTGGRYFLSIERWGGGCFIGHHLRMTFKSLVPR
jgi:hypothetical protein